MNTWNDLRLGVAGLGRTGLACLKVAEGLGIDVLGIDASEQAVDEARSAWPTIRIEQVGDIQAAADLYRGLDVVVMSPGIAPHQPLFAAASEVGIPVWSEVEFAWRIQQSGPNPDVPWLAITGTNGKTTTVGMTSSILSAAGMRAPAVGNVGAPIVEAVADGGIDALAVELSSFQLATTQTMEPAASVCLNVASDHLDWHGSLAEYAKAKARVYAHTRLACVYNREAPETITMIEEADVAEGARAVGFTLGIPALGEVGCVEDVICDRAFEPNRRKQALALATFADLAHLGSERPATTVLSDALAAATLTRALDIDPDTVAAGLRAFHPAGHRRAVVSQATGVTWIDDSKATNAHAAAASLRGCGERSVVWIAGGLTKGQRFDELIKEVAPVLRGVVLIGVDRQALREALARHAPQVPVVELEDHPEIMTSAVNEAVALSLPGDSVILAPACASWDQFPNYRVRGDAFVAAVEGLGTP